MTEENEVMATQEEESVLPPFVFELQCSNLDSTAVKEISLPKFLLKTSARTMVGEKSNITVVLNGLPHVYAQVLKVVNDGFSKFSLNLIETETGEVAMTWKFPDVRVHAVDFGSFSNVAEREVALELSYESFSIDNVEFVAS